MISFYCNDVFRVQMSSDDQFFAVMMCLEFR